MYSQDIITTLTNRIGFGLPLENGFAYNVSEANSTGTSLRLFNKFHALCTIENIFSALPELENEAAFNSVLTGIRSAAVLEVLPVVLNKHKDYDNATDYDQTITDNITLFDDCIGYKGAIMILEMIMTTKESNLAERNAKLTASSLKLEIEGFKNDYGHLVASGLVQKYNLSIQRAVDKIFPQFPEVKTGPNW